MKFDAYEFATGWLSVSLASSSDKDRAQLNRTVLIETYTNGVQLVATDGYVLLTSWVPAAGCDLEPCPGIDEAPISTAVAMDPDGRSKLLCHYARVLVARAEKDDGEDPPDMRLDLGVVFTEDDDAPRGFAGMEPRWAVLEIVETERVKLQLYEGDYPAWRRVMETFKPRTTKVVALNPEIVGRLSKLGNLHKGALLGWEFGGDVKPARVQVIDSEPCISGLVMPCRWDMDRNEPIVDDEPEPDPDGEGEAKPERPLKVVK